jgi:hypothetical protein
MKWCTFGADWSVWQPKWADRPERFKFMCDWHFQEYRKPIPGIHAPENAPDDWRPSLMDCIRLAQIAISFEERDKKLASIPESPPLHRSDDAKKYTPAQLDQILFLRNYARRGLQ